LVKPVIGLTGPTGAGKSTWSAAFQKLGCAVIDCDKIAREVTDHAEVRQALQKEFGADILQNGTLDRRKLAMRAFADADSVRRLNSVTHPAIRKIILQQLQQFSRDDTVKAIFLDAPLLFEGGLEQFCTMTAAVLAPQELRLSRILKRDGISKDEALRRMASQHDDSYFRSHADFLLDGATLPEKVPSAAAKQLSVWLGEENL